VLFFVVGVGVPKKFVVFCLWVFFMLPCPSACRFFPGIGLIICYKYCL